MFVIFLPFHLFHYWFLLSKLRPEISVLDLISLGVVVSNFFYFHSNNTSKFQGEHNIIGKKFLLRSHKILKLNRKYLSWLSIRCCFFTWMDWVGIMAASILKFLNLISAQNWKYKKDYSSTKKWFGRTNFFFL